MRNARLTNTNSTRAGSAQRSPVVLRLMSLERSIAVATCVLLFTAHAPSQSRRRGGEPGVFDYYVLALSWSPQFCSSSAGIAEPGQCSGTRQFGFVVHGLWPQYEHGYPQDCAAARPLDQNLVKRMLPLMPSARLIAHEWRAHGTCSGLSVPAYFDQIEKARATVAIPSDFQAPTAQVIVTAREVKAKFARANPWAPESAFRVTCSGRYLSEVRVCLTKDLKERACSSDLRDGCRAGDIIMRPLR